MVSDFTDEERKAKVLSSAYSRILGNGPTMSDPGLWLQSCALPPTWAASWVFRSHHVISMSLGPVLHEHGKSRLGGLASGNLYYDKGDRYDSHPSQLQVGCSSVNRT